jgi:hypothetical protein
VDNIAVFNAHFLLVMLMQNGGMAMITVNSSSIRAVGYDGCTLAVQFHTSDTIYSHSGVPYSVYAGLMQASSMGGYYNRYIRGKYQ